MFLLGMSAIAYSIFKMPTDIETESEFLRALAYVVVWGGAIGFGIVVPAQEISRKMNEDD